VARTAGDAVIVVTVSVVAVEMDGEIVTVLVGVVVVVYTVVPGVEDGVNVVVEVRVVVVATLGTA